MDVGTKIALVASKPGIARDAINVSTRLDFSHHSQSADRGQQTLWPVSPPMISQNLLSEISGPLKDIAPLSRYSRTISRGTWPKGQAQTRGWWGMAKRLAVFLYGLVSYIVFFL